MNGIPLYISNTFVGVLYMAVSIELDTQELGKITTVEGLRNGRQWQTI